MNDGEEIGSLWNRAIEVTVEEDVRHTQFESFVAQEADRLLRILDDRVSPSAELSILLVGDEGMRELNRQWRDADRTTDVLSFPQLDGDPRWAVLGDVVLNLDAVVRQARSHGLSEHEELRFLLIHAVLHLLGHDHHQDDERVTMEAEEQRLWEAMGGRGRIR